MSEKERESFEALIKDCEAAAETIREVKHRESFKAVVQELIDARQEELEALEKEGD